MGGVDSNGARKAKVSINGSRFYTGCRRVRSLLVKEIVETVELRCHFSGDYRPVFNAGSRYDDDLLIVSKFLVACTIVGIDV